MTADELLIGMGNGQAHTQTVSTAEEKKRHSSMRPTQIQTDKSVKMDSVFDHQVRKPSNDHGKKLRKGKSGRKSQVTYNQDLMIEGLTTSGIVNMPQVQNMQDQIDESEREMKELMARDLLMQDDLIGAGSSIENNINFDTTVRFGIGAIFGPNEQQSLMNQSDYSQLMKTTEKHKNDKALRNKQDFSTQINGHDNEHMYLTMANL